MITLLARFQSPLFVMHLHMPTFCQPCPSSYESSVSFELGKWTLNNSFSVSFPIWVCCPLGSLIVPTVTCLVYVTWQITSRHIRYSEFIAHSLLHLYNYNYCHRQYHNYISYWSHCHSPDTTQSITQYSLITHNGFNPHCSLLAQYSLHNHSE
jgi:hypothetical protein